MSRCSRKFAQVSRKIPIILRRMVVPLEKEYWSTLNWSGSLGIVRMAVSHWFPSKAVLRVSFATKTVFSSVIEKFAKSLHYSLSCSLETALTYCILIEKGWPLKVSLQQGQEPLNIQHPLKKNRQALERTDEKLPIGSWNPWRLRGCLAPQASSNGCCCRCFYQWKRLVNPVEGILGITTASLFFNRCSCLNRDFLTGNHLLFKP